MSTPLLSTKTTPDGATVLDPLATAGGLSAAAVPAEPSALAERGAPSPAKRYLPKTIPRVATSVRVLGETEAPHDRETVVTRWISVANVRVKTRFAIRYERPEAWVGLTERVQEIYAGYDQEQGKSIYKRKLIWTLSLFHGPHGAAYRQKDRPTFRSLDEAVAAGAAEAARLRLEFRGVTERFDCTRTGGQ